MDHGAALIVVIAAVASAAVLVMGVLMSRFLTTVPAGTIRIVSWWRGGIRIYKGPGRAVEVPLLTTAASIPSQAINLDLDITDQTADRDAVGVPRPIKVNVQASAIVAVGDTDEMILTAANRFFSKADAEQDGTLTDLLTSAGRRAVNLLRHDQLFSALAAPALVATDAPPSATSSALATTAPAPLAKRDTNQDQDDDEDEDPLAVIIKRQCSRELHDLGLTFKSLNIKIVNSEVAEARRRQTAMEAKANADIVQAEQERRAQEAKLTAMQQISDKDRELQRRKAENAAQIAQAEALKQEALAVQRAAELKATQIAQATADAERAKVEALGKAEAERLRLITIAQGEAERTRLLAIAQADAIAKINAAISAGGDAYLRLRQLEMLPQIAPDIAGALAQARIINVSDSGGAAVGATNQITTVLQTVLAAQLLKEGLAAPPPPPERETVPASPAPEVPKDALPKKPR